MKRLVETFVIDARSLAACRIGFGILILIDLWQRSLNLDDHYTDWGLLPRDPLILNFVHQDAVSFHLANGSAAFIGIMFMLAASFAVGLIFGWKTRLMALLSWAFMVSIHHRNPIILQSGDFLLRSILFWMIFCRPGSCFSIDAALKSYREPVRQLSVPSAILLLQVSLMYFFAASLKNSSQWWPDGTATWYALQLDQYTTTFGTWLGQFFEVTKILTYSVWIIEWLAAPLLLAPMFLGITLGVRVRIVTVFILMGLHLGFAASLYVGLFSWIDLVSLLIFLPSIFWNCLSRYFSPKDMPQLIYDGGCSFCEKFLKILAEFFLWDQKKLISSKTDPKLDHEIQESNSWIVITSNGNYYRQWEGLAVAIGASRLGLTWLQKLMLLPYMSILGDRLYLLVARNRGVISRLCRVLFPYDKNKIRPYSIIAAVITSVLFTMVIVWNAGNDPRLLQGKFKDPFLYSVLIPLGLNQNWGMFAPHPSINDGWYVIKGNLDDGREVEVFEGTLGTVNWEKPNNVASKFRSQRWRKYLVNLHAIENKDYRLYFGKYLCRRWERLYGNIGHLYEYKIHYMLEKTTGPFEKKIKIENLILWNHKCYEK